MIKLHRPLAEAVVNCVDAIFNQNRYADKAIEYTLKQNRKWGSRDRAFIAEYTYEMVRWWRLLQFIADRNDRQDKDAIWNVFAVLHLQKGYELPAWNEFRNMDFHGIVKRMDASTERRIMQSVPDWMDEMGERELGAQWDAELHALNKTAPFVLRVNTLKTSREKLISLLIKEGVEAENIKGYDDALVVRKRANVFGFDAFKNGMFEVQDASSQLVAPFMQPEPGMRVIDACAGAGGKTLHIASLMENKGRIISMDTEGWKLEELMKRAKRAGAGNIETRVIESGKTIKRLEGSADRLLLDVPCSGLGVLKRNPDAKWKLQPEFIANIRNTQREILGSYPTMLKPGGMMVYATCSILPSEDEEQVKWFLEQQPSFTLVEQKRISATEGFDGFFMALIKKES